MDPTIREIEVQVSPDWEKTGVASRETWPRFKMRALSERIIDSPLEVVAVTRIETIPNVKLGVEVAGAIANFVLLETAPTGTDKDTTREADQLVCIVALMEVMLFESTLTRPVTGVSIDATSGKGGGGGALGIMLGVEIEEGDVLPLFEAVTAKV